MFQRRCFTISCTLIISAWITCASSSPSRYGKPCSSSQRCDSEALLSCQDGTCQCQLPESMTYAPATGKCGVIPGAKCVFSTVEVNEKMRERRREELICVANATCDNGFCACDKGFFQSSNITCSPKYSYGENCESNVECRRDQNLICNKNTSKCDCDSTQTVFDNSKKMCAIRSGSPCESSSDCVAHANCVEEVNRRNEMVCSCAKSAFEGEDGTCEWKGDHGKSCKSKDNCKNEFICSGGFCHCNESEAYDERQKKCIGLANSPCVAGHGSSSTRSDWQCVPNAECKNVLGESERVCVCRSEYEASSNGSCLIPFGKPCGNDWTKSCNFNHGLICVEGKCQCKFGSYQSFNSTLKKCLSYIEGVCDELTACPEGSHCSSKLGYTSCQCNSGLVAVNHKCMLEYGQRCNQREYQNEQDTNPRRTGLPCDSMAPLSCINGICQCSQLEVYDGELMKCRGLVGSTCNIFQENDLQHEYCVDGADCVKFRVTLSSPLAVCQCKAGLTVTSEKLCVRNDHL